MTKPDAVIFDMDGTLTDTEIVWHEVRSSLAARAGRPYPDDASQIMMGLSTKEWAGYLRDGVGIPGTAEEIAEQVITEIADRHARSLTVLPGAVAAVRRLANHCPIAVASSSPPRLIEVSLTKMGVIDLFTTWLSTESVPRGKPHPDGFLAVAERLGADPARCIVIEDSTNGLLSALAAGMRTVAVPPHFHPPVAEILQRCDVVLEDLDGLTTDLVDSLIP